MNKFIKYFTPSRTSPKNSRKGCLCRDRDVYSIKCCNGDIMNQGIGSTSSQETSPSPGDYGYKVQRCGHSQQKHVHGTEELIIGNVYYLSLDHSGHSNCYTVLSSDNQTSGFHWNNVTSYNDCTTCENEN